MFVRKAVAEVYASCYSGVWGEWCETLVNDHFSTIIILSEDDTDITSVTCKSWNNFQPSTKSGLLLLANEWGVPSWRNNYQQKDGSLQFPNIPSPAYANISENSRRNSNNKPNYIYPRRNESGWKEWRISRGKVADWLFPAWVRKKLYRHVGNISILFPPASNIRMLPLRFPINEYFIIKLPPEHTLCALVASASFFLFCVCM